MSKNNDNQPSTGAGDGSGVEVHSYKALPRDPNQPEHKRPRVFLHRPAEAYDSSAEDEARKSASMIEAAKTIQLEDFTKIHHRPCVRDAFLPSISGGVVVGATRFVLGASVLKSCNWACGCFVGISVVVYNFCQRRRHLEKDGIRRAVRILDEKQAMLNAENGSTGTAQAGTAGATQAQKEPVNFWSTFKFW